MEEKKRIRESILKLRDALLKEERLEKSRRIFNRITAMREYQEAEHILVYVSYKSEVETEPFIKESLKAGKKVYCPKVCGKNMDFYRIADTAELKHGYMGIKEPEAAKEYVFNTEVGKKGNCLMIMPGSAYDMDRNRIGYGGGYYDRYLESHPFITAIAVGFDCQITERIPAASHDKKPDIIITEERLI